jgi:hypothetical protein
MLYSEIIAVCSQIHRKHINTMWVERTAQWTHSFSVIKSHLMLYSEIIAICSQIHRKYKDLAERTAQ